MCLDESMVKWLGRNMPGFMHVFRKPTPKGAELHTLCCGVCGILLWFELWEGKEAMAKKDHCEEYKRKLGASGPWKSVALTIRMVTPFIGNGVGRVLIADSWFGSVPCILALYCIGVFAVMMVKTAHKDYPKQALLGKLGYDAKTKVCPKERRGEHYGYTRNYSTDQGTCQVLASGHNSKKPVLIVSTASTLQRASDYVKSWTKPNALGQMVTFTIRVMTTMAHALYHKFFHRVDVHNHLRQGVTAMADVWDTKDWSHRHFAEGLGFWEVNVFLALTRWHPEYPKLTHTHFRVLLAHAMLTLGKVKFGEAVGEAAASAGPSCSYCVLENFNKLDDGGDNEGHKCAYCPKKAYFYCKACFPDGGTTITAACCNPELGRDCFAKHVAKVQPAHGMRRKIATAATRKSPRRNTQARTGDDADDADDDDDGESPPLRPRRLDPD
jgi:hypothetical protein